MTMKTQEINLNNALLGAVLFGDINHINFLLNENIDINCRTKTYRETPLYLSCFTGNYKIAELLLKHNANPNIQDERGVTALMIACLYGYTDIVKLLLEYGTDPNLKTKSGMTAINLASNCRHNEIVFILEKS